MVEHGHAWAYTYFTMEYAEAQAKAKYKRLGLWSNPNPINPYEFRKTNR